MTLQDINSGAAPVPLLQIGGDVALTREIQTRLGQIGMQVGIGILKPKVNFCPYCGVSLDQPLPAAQSAAQSLNPIK